MTKNRYEVTFVIETDAEDVGRLPWYPLIGDDVMPVDWLEYIRVRQLADTEMNLKDLTPEDSITMIDMTYQATKEDKPVDYIKLVVDNDRQDTEDKPDSKDPTEQ